MSSKHSRKSFFTQILGVLATVGFMPRLIAGPRATAPSDAPGAAPFKIQPDTRAISRSADAR